MSLRVLCSDGASLQLGSAWWGCQGRTSWWWDIEFVIAGTPGCQAHHLPPSVRLNRQPRWVRFHELFQLPVLLSLDGSPAQPGRAEQRGRHPRRPAQEVFPRSSPLRFRNTSTFRVHLVVVLFAILLKTMHRQQHAHAACN